MELFYDLITLSSMYPTVFPSVTCFGCFHLLFPEQLWRKIKNDDIFILPSCFLYSFLSQLSSVDLHTSSFVTLVPFLSLV